MCTPIASVNMCTWKQEQQKVRGKGDTWWGKEAQKVWYFPIASETVWPYLVSNLYGTDIE
jgi:hypothetical protein